MSDPKKISDEKLMGVFQKRQPLLTALEVRKVEFSSEKQEKPRVELGVAGEESAFSFGVSLVRDYTPLSVRKAVQEAQGTGGYKIIVISYFSNENLSLLEEAGISGVDLCGNGVVMVPGRLFVKSVGNKNRYPQSRPLANPYAGRSALVGRVLLEQPEWETLKAMVKSVMEAGGIISMPQASKAVQAMAEDLLVVKEKGGRIVLKDAAGLLERLGREFTPSGVSAREYVRLPESVDWRDPLAGLSGIRWAVTGESTVNRYAALGQGGPMRVAVSSMGSALSQLGGSREAVPNFAEIELMETDELEFYFQNEVDEVGIRWASPVQTWLELQAGDARQQDAARELKKKILSWLAS